MSEEREGRTLHEREMGSGGEAVRGRAAPEVVPADPGERSPYVEPAAPAESIAVPGTPDPVLGSVMSEDWGRVIATTDEDA